MENLSCQLVAPNMTDIDVHAWKGLAGLDILYHSTYLSGHSGMEKKRK